MRRTWIGMVVLGLLVVASARGGEDTAARPVAPAAAAKKAAKSPEAGASKKTEAEKNEKAPPREPSAVEAELEQLRVLILEQSKELVAQRAAMREQQQRMSALEEQLRTAHATPVAAIPAGSAVIAGATAAAATSIVTTPYYAGVAAVDAGGKALDYAKDNLTVNPSEIDWDRTVKPWKWF